MSIKDKIRKSPPIPGIQLSKKEKINKTIKKEKKRKLTFVWLRKGRT